MTSSLIYKTDNTEVFHRKGSSKKILITFNEIHTSANGADYWGKKLVEKLDYECISFVSRFPHWFPEFEMSQLIAKIQHLLNKPTIIYGFSQGAYATLKYVSHLNASLAIAFSPQSSINPSDTKDRRYINYFDPQLHSGMQISESDRINLTNSANIFVVYDPLHGADRAHVEYLSSVLTFTKVALPLSGHASVKAIFGSGNFKKFIEACEQNDLNMMKRILRSGRANSQEIIAEAAQTCWLKGKKRWGDQLSAQAKFMGYLGTLPRAECLLD